MSLQIRRSCRSAQIALNTHSVSQSLHFQFVLLNGRNTLLMRTRFRSLHFGIIQKYILITYRNDLYYLKNITSSRSEFENRTLEENSYFLSSLKVTYFTQRKCTCTKENPVQVIMEIGYKCLGWLGHLCGCVHFCYASAPATAMAGGIVFQVVRPSVRPYVPFL